MENYIVSVLSPLCQARANGNRIAEGKFPRSPLQREECDLCTLTFDPQFLYRIGSLRLCPSCRDVYSDACYAAFSDDFIEEKADSFYPGWFEGLSPSRQLILLKRAYRAEYRRMNSAGQAQMRAERREFCSSSVNEEWPDYVTKRINGAYNNILH